MELMRGVVDPELGSNLVELGMARGAQVSDDGLVRVEIALTTSGCPLRAQIQKDVKVRLESLPGVTKVRIVWAELTADEKAAAMAKARFNVSKRAPDTAIPPTTKVLMVASGKGGVGKSTVSTNLAAALAAEGFNVGVMDADIWGYSVPQMLGVDGELRSDGGKIVPISRTIGEGRVDVVSMGFLVDREDSALMWRGLMLNRAVQHFCEDVRWNDDLDYLVIDMPPGTGDVQMGLAKMLPRAEMIIVTTPGGSRPEGGRESGGHGPQELPAHRGRDREHELPGHARRPPSSRVRRGRGARPSRPRSGSRCWAAFPSNVPLPTASTRASR